ncbi:MAG TPA: phage holin family protein [Acidimicrobiales bacterium]|jgi:hypothetical protein
MVSTAPPRAPYGEPEAPPEQDWPSQVADTIVQVVGSVRDKTTGPALQVAKAVVYGTVAAIIGLIALVIFTIAAVRFLNAYLPDAVFGETHMWASYLILGLIFVIAGGILWSRRRTPEQTPRY